MKEPLLDLLFELGLWELLTFGLKLGFALDAYTVAASGSMYEKEFVKNI